MCGCSYQGFINFDSLKECDIDVHDEYKSYKVKHYDSNTSMFTANDIFLNILGSDCKLYTELKSYRVNLYKIKKIQNYQLKGYEFIDKKESSNSDITKFLEKKYKELSNCNLQKTELVSDFVPDLCYDECKLTIDNKLNFKMHHKKYDFVIKAIASDNNANANDNANANANANAKDNNAKNNDNANANANANAKDNDNNDNDNNDNNANNDNDDSCYSYKYLKHYVYKKHFEDNSEDPRFYTDFTCWLNVNSYSVKHPENHYCDKFDLKVDGEYLYFICEDENGNEFLSFYNSD
jgi:hypothetical protein